MGAACVASDIFLCGRRQRTAIRGDHDFQQRTPLARPTRTHRACNGPALMTGNLLVCPDRDALNVRAAECFRDLAKKSIFGSGTFNVALSGGSTPKSLYALLASPQWSAQI